MDSIVLYKLRPFCAIRIHHVFHYPYQHCNLFLLQFIPFLFALDQSLIFHHIVHVVKTVASVIHRGITLTSKCPAL